MAKSKHMDFTATARRCLVPVLAVFYTIWAIYVMGPFALGCVGSGYTGIDTSPYGTPARPQVYRVLMTGIVKAIQPLVPAAVEAPITKKLIEWRDSAEGRATQKFFFRKPPLGDAIIFESFLVLSICYFTFLAFLAMLYIFTRAVFPESTAYALLAPALALQLLPILTINNAYIYDFSELFFACLLFYLLLNERFTLYLIAFIIATLNKETTIFTLVFFTTWFYRRLPLPLYAKLLAAQIALYAVIKGGLTWYFASYPGVLIGPPLTLAGNLNYLIQYGDYKAILFMLVLMLYRWKQKPVYLRGSAPMILAHIAIYITICIPGEYRDFYWSLPFMLLMISHSLVSGVDMAGHPVFRPRNAV